MAVAWLCARSGAWASASYKRAAVTLQREAVARAAIYYAPPENSALAERAEAWFGDQVAQSVTASPRHYGFHATLKAPFRLAVGSSLSDLLGAVERFAGARRWIEGPALHVSELGSFLALVPSQLDGRVNALAADCVQAFEPYRAPLQQAELAKRRAAGLSARQEQYLLDWGYPYVMEEFRFHMTLTESLPDAERAHWKAVLEAHFAPLAGHPLLIDGISVFVQDSLDSPFRHYARLPFEAR